MCDAYPRLSQRPWAKACFHSIRHAGTEETDFRGALVITRIKDPLWRLPLGIGSAPDLAEESRVSEDSRVRTL